MRRYALDVYYYRNEHCPGELCVDIDLEHIPLKTKSGCTGIGTSIGLKSVQSVACWVNDQLVQEFGHNYPINVSLIFLRHSSDLCTIDIGQSGDEMEDDIDSMAKKFEVIDVDSDDLDYEAETAADAPDGCDAYSDGHDLVICSGSSEEEETDWEAAYYNGR